MSNLFVSLREVVQIGFRRILIEFEANLLSW